MPECKECRNKDETIAQLREVLELAKGTLELVKTKEKPICRCPICEIEATGPRKP